MAEMVRRRAWRFVFAGSPGRARMTHDARPAGCTSGREGQARAVSGRQGRRERGHRGERGQDQEGHATDARAIWRSAGRTLQTRWMTRGRLAYRAGIGLEFPIATTPPGLKHVL